MANNERSASVKIPATDVTPVGEGPADDLQLSADTRRPARIGLWAIGLGLGGFLLWAGFAPLDEGVPSSGTVSIETKRNTVAHLTGGVIKEVLVREGQQVAEGEVLLRLDEAVARANYETVRQRYLGLRATQSRLQAEQVGAAKIAFHPDLLAVKADPLIARQVQTQEQLFESRRAALRADLQAIEESVRGQEAMLESYKAMLKSRRAQLSLIAEELENTRGLVKEGYVPRNRQLELERMAAEANATIAELIGNIDRANRGIAELRQRALFRQQEYRKEVESQLAEVTPEVQSDAERISAVRLELDRVEIKAPASGQVVGLTPQTVGGVVQPGQKVMDIVPKDQSLLLDVKIAPNLIDRVRPGQATDIRFSTFAHTPQLVVEGRLESVSGDLLAEPQNPQIVYYLGRVRVTENGLATLGALRMQAGMPAEVIIKTGERSLLTYILHPLLRRIASSMKEV